MEGDEREEGLEGIKIGGEKREVKDRGRQTMQI